MEISVDKTKAVSKMTKLLVLSTSLTLMVFAALAGASNASAGPYTLVDVIAIPATASNVQGGSFLGFGTGYFSSATGDFYIADKSNASVDIISGSTLAVIGQVQGFTGQTALTSTSGPNGIMTVTSGGTTTLFAGDGNSTLKVFDITNPAAPTLLQSISTGGSFRVNDMAYSPLTGQVLTGNPSDATAFATLFNTTSGTSPLTTALTGITIPLSTGGIQQPVWDANTGSFFVSIPSFTGSGDPGGVAEISTSGTVLRTIHFATLGITSCSPTGLALGASGNLMVGCADTSTQNILLSPAGSGSIVTTFPVISGTDEVWYDPTTGFFFDTGRDAGGNRVFDVISDTSDAVLQSVLLPVSALSNAHSIAVDSLTGDVFVPLAGNTTSVGGNTACAAGCVAVYASSANVPEPSSLSLSLVFGAVMILGFAVGGRRFREMVRH
jgi:hypothetical protein